jgi:hypothetical protein
VSDSVWLAVVGGAATAVLSAISPGNRSLAVDIYVLVLGALALLALGRIARSAQAGAPSSFDEALRPEPVAHERPAELVRLEREVVLASARAFDLHFRLRPLLREIADHRLRRRHGSGLDESGEGPREALGEPAWQLLRPDLPTPEDRLGPGLPLAELRRVVDALERI